MERLTSTQIGAIAVNHVANALMISSKGRFAVFTPVADDDGRPIMKSGTHNAVLVMRLYSSPEQVQFSSDRLYVASMRGFGGAFANAS